MKKLTVLFLAGLLLVPAMFAEAATVGSPETVGQGKVSLGLNQEVGFNKDLEMSSTSASGTTYSGIKFDEIYRTEAKVSYGILDNLDMYVNLGVADYKAKEDWNDGTDYGDIVSKARNAFMWGVGFKGTMMLDNDWIVGADMQYLRHRNKYAYWINNVSTPASSEGASGKMTVQEWHFAPYVAKKIDDFTPYAGVRYSDAKLKDNYTPSSGAVEEKKEADSNFGIFLGTDYTVNDQWKVNVEARFVDETAISLGTTYSF